MRYFYYIVVFMATAALTSCKKEVQPDNAGRFMKFYGKGLIDYAYDLQQTSDGDYIIAGYTENSSQKREAYALRISSFGDIVWQKTYGEGSNFSEFKKVSIYEDGFVFMGTYEDTLASLSKEMYLVKTSFDGDVIWEGKHGGAQDQEGNDFGTMSNGDFILAGSSTKANNVTIGNATGSNPQGRKDFYIIRVTSEGDSIVNSYQAGGENDDEIKSIAVTWEGFIYAAGVLNYQFTFANLNNDNISIIALNTQSGKFAVDDNYGFGSLGNDLCSSIIMDGEGMLLAGNTNNFSNAFINKVVSRTNLRQIDSSLTNALETIDGMEELVINDAAHTPEGGYIIVGQSNGMALINMDSEGTILWSRIDADLDGANSGTAVIPTMEGGFAVIGNAGFGVDGDIMLLKVNNEGSL